MWQFIETKIFIICSVAIIRCNTFFGSKLKFVINFLKILNKNDKIQQKTQKILLYSHVLHLSPLLAILSPTVGRH